MLSRLLSSKKSSKDQRVDFNTAVEQHYDTLYGNAIRLTHNEADAGDLVQETLLRGYRAWEKFDQKNTRAWLLKIQYHCFVNFYHKSKRERAHLDPRDSEQLLERIEDHSGSQLPERTDREFLSHFIGGEVMEGLDTLPPEYRMTVLLSDFHGLQYQEIADILECPIGTVMSRLHRGRKRLQRHLFEVAKAAGVIPAQIIDFEAYQVWSARR